MLTRMSMPEFVAQLRRSVGHAPLWLSGATAVVVRAGVRGDEVLLIKRADDGAWSSVCGIVDPGEEPGEAAVREAAEEAGVRIEVERLVWLSVTDVVTYENGDQTQYIDHTFRCSWVAGEPYPADGEAIIANKRCSVEMYSSLKPEASLKASCNTRWVSFERWVPPKP